MAARGKESWYGCIGCHSRDLLQKYAKNLHRDLLLDDKCGGAHRPTIQIATTKWRYITL